MPDLKLMTRSGPPPALPQTPYTVRRVNDATIAPAIKQRFGSEAKPPGQVVSLQLMHGGQAVGFAQLGLGQVAQIAWMHVDRAHWGTGGADHLAIASLHEIHRAGYGDVHALVDPSNAASVKLAKRHGGSWD